MGREAFFSHRNSAIAWHKASEASERRRGLKGFGFVQGPSVNFSASVGGEGCRNLNERIRAHLHGR